MRLTIKEYWNKVVPDPTQPFGTRVLPEYELKNELSWNDPGYASRKEWQKRVSGFSDFVRFEIDGSAYFDRGRNYGIHTYQIVKLTE